MNLENKTQMHLSVPEQPILLINDESPIDRYGPSLRGSSSPDPRVERRSSCYSRNTDGYSIHEREHEHTKGQEYDIEKDIDDGAIGEISRPAPAHLSVYSGRYMTRHGNESRLILQGLSDPYRSGSNSVSSRSPYEVNDYALSGSTYIGSNSSLQPIYPLRTNPNNHPMQRPLPSPRTQNWRVEKGITMLSRPNPRFARPPVTPIRPLRWSAVSPSFRTPTSLVSPFKVPPSIVTSSMSRLGQHPIDSKSACSNSKIQRYPLKKDVILIVLAVVMATFCTSMDRIIVSTAIPTMTSQFNTIEDIGWYTTSYLLTACSAHLFYTKLYRFYTAKWIYMMALLIFEIGSLVSVVAEVSATLIFGRALAGLGASGVLAGDALMMGQCGRLSRISSYFAVYSSGVFVVGPVLGGVLTQYASWRWCFFINLPFALSSCILLLISRWETPPNIKTQSTFKQRLPFLDLEGTLLFLPSILCLLLAVQWGGVKFPWSSATVIVLLAVFVVTITGFILIQKYKSESASIQPQMFLNRNVYGGMMASFCLGGSISVVVYYLPLWFQVTKDVSPSDSGVMLLPLVLSMAIASLASSHLVNIIGYCTPFLILASVMMSTGSGLLTTIQESTTLSAWVGYQILFGIGAGSGIHQTTLAILSSFQKSRHIAHGTAMMIFAQTLGAACAIGVAQSVFENKLINSIKAAELDGVRVQAVLHTGATVIRNVLSGDNLETVLMLYTRAIDQGFYVSVGLAAVSVIGALVMEWNPVQGRRALVVF
uniref:Putative HC-toxin efflux carrier TOXA n=1 Tax=Talaromyces marneffei PM1 TaxID=1077442 RepID=A0A093V9J0_TALMA